MFRNKEYKSIIIKLIIMQSIFAIIIFLFVHFTIKDITKDVIKRDISLMGNILKDNPELEKDIVPYITKEIEEENFKIGENTLKDYGYNISLKDKNHPILKHNKNIPMYMSFSIILFLLPLIFLITIEYKKIYKRIRKISFMSEKIVEGNFSERLSEQDEGDFHILNHQFNQMANRLENSIEGLSKEKIFLKDTMADISHQLKTPLSSLIMINDILLHDNSMDDVVKKDFLEKMESQINRMEWLIINLLKVARIEAGAIDFKREKVYFKEILDIINKSLEIKLKDQKINSLGEKDGYFYGDKNWTSEAIINIVKNAIEHGGDKIDIIFSQTPLFSRIEVKDNGEGIDKKHLKNIFKRFYKVSSEVKPESIGIGLNLSKLIIESQNGNISVKSKKGEYTKFIITFLNKTT